MKRIANLMSSSLDMQSEVICRDRRHSSDLASLLRQFSSSLEYHQENPKRLQGLIKMLLGYRSLSLCPEQRRNLEYLVAQYYQVLEDFKNARLHLQIARESAIQLDDDAALISLLYYEGEIERRLIQYPNALNTHQTALSLLKHLQYRGVAIDRKAELTLLLYLSGESLELGNFEVGSGYIANARELQQQLDVRTRERFFLGWHTVQNYRLSGRPARAYHQALQTLRELDDALWQEQKVSIGRFYTVMAECLLDIATIHCSLGGVNRAFSPILRLGHDPLELIERFNSNDCLELAGSYLESAIHYAEETADPGGLNMAHLAQRRRVRLGGYIVNRQFSTDRNIAVATITINIASKINDYPLVGRALTSLGDELLAQGDRFGAREKYIKALDVLSKHQLHGLAVSTRQRLLVAATL